MEKVLILGQGSKNDPGFTNIQVNGQLTSNYMESKGVRVIDNLVESCHGCLELMTHYSKQIQNFVDRGNRVVEVLEGGRLFGLPSIQATQTTIPIISVPMDIPSYHAFMVPSGHAVVAGVGIDKSDNYQKKKALTLAERILNLNKQGVNIISNSDGEGRMIKELESIGITDINIKLDSFDGLTLLYGNNIRNVPRNGFFIWADSNENLKDSDYLRFTENKHHDLSYNKAPSAQVSGIRNLPIYAAKIMSLQNSSIREKIEKIGIDKGSTYTKRDLVLELRGG